MNNKTIQYYNNNAEDYYYSTANIDFNDKYERFLKYVPKCGHILDVGCGSGRDTLAFIQRGYYVTGLDASEQLAFTVREKKGIQIIVADMSEWISNKPFDAIWCCASLLHLDDDGVRSFFRNLKHNLKPGGVIYLSVKTGIKTGYDGKGRYVRNFTEKELGQFLERASCHIVECWNTGDQLDRDGFNWINIIGMMNLV